MLSVATRINHVPFLFNIVRQFWFLRMCKNISNVLILCIHNCDYWTYLENVFFGCFTLRSVGHGQDRPTIKLVTLRYSCGRKLCSHTDTIPNVNLPPSSWHWTTINSNVTVISHWNLELWTYLTIQLCIPQPTNRTKAKTWTIIKRALSIYCGL